MLAFQNLLYFSPSFLMASVDVKILINTVARNFHPLIGNQQRGWKHEYTEEKHSNKNYKIYFFPNQFKTAMLNPVLKDPTLPGFISLDYSKAVSIRVQKHSI